MHLDDLEQTELEDIIYLPHDFNYEKWLKQKARICVNKLLCSEYPKKSFSIEFKNKYLKNTTVISIYFRKSELRDKNISNLSLSVRLERINIHSLFQKKSFFKSLVYYLKKSKKFKYLHIGNIENDSWLEYFRNKSKVDTNCIGESSAYPFLSNNSFDQRSFIIFL